jgi:hypothetical protein
MTNNVFMNAARPPPAHNINKMTNTEENNIEEAYIAIDMWKKKTRIPQSRQTNISTRVPVL